MHADLADRSEEASHGHHGVRPCLFSRVIRISGLRAQALSVLRY